MRDVERSIDRQASLPIYRQLKEIIKEKIEDGKFRPGNRIPTEYELCEQFEISRAPVRQALLELVNEGVLYRQQGSGTFVNHHCGERARSLRVIVTEDLWILDILRVLWQGRFLSLVRETEAMSDKEAEAYIQGQLAVFEEQRSMLSD